MMSVEQLFQQFKAGDRVRADLDIVYAIHDVTVREGALGRVTQDRVHGVSAVVMVLWDESAGWAKHCGKSLATTVDCLTSAPREGL